LGIGGRGRALLAMMMIMVFRMFVAHFWVMEIFPGRKNDQILEGKMEGHKKRGQRSKMRKGSKNPSIHSFFEVHKNE
jgi:hypothetical protein